MNFRASRSAAPATAEPLASETNKLTRVKKETTIQMAIIGAGLAVLGIIYFLMNQWLESVETEQQQINSAVSGLNLEIQQLEEEFAKARQSIDLYDSMKSKVTKGSRKIDRQQIVPLIGELKKLHYIVSLEMEMTPLKPLEDERFVRQNTRVMQTTITLDFETLTDEFALRFMDDLIRNLPGYVRPSHVELSVKGKVDQLFLQNLTQGNFHGLVKGKLVLHVLSLEKTSEEKGGTPNAAL